MTAINDDCYNFCMVGDEENYQQGIILEPFDNDDNNNDNDVQKSTGLVVGSPGKNNNKNNINLPPQPTVGLKKRRKPRKSVAPKKLLLLSTTPTVDSPAEEAATLSKPPPPPPPTRPLRRSERKRNVQTMSSSSSSSKTTNSCFPSSSLSSSIKTLKTLNVVIPSDTAIFKISMTEDNVEDGLMSHKDDQQLLQPPPPDMEELLEDRTQSSVPTMTLEQHRQQYQHQPLRYTGGEISGLQPPSSSFLPMSSPWSQQQLSPTRNDQISLSVRKSPPKSILRSKKKKPRVLGEEDTDGVVNSSGNDVNDDERRDSEDGAICDAQLDALLKSSSGGSPSPVHNTVSNTTTTTTTTTAGVDMEEGQDSDQPMHQPNSNNVDTEDFDADCIQHRMSLLFPSGTYMEIKKTPCILPRLIACFTLYRDDEMMLTEEEAGPITLKPTTPKVTTRRRKRSMDAKTKSIQEVLSIRSFLYSLVDLELNLLSGRGADANVSGKKGPKLSGGNTNTIRPSPHTRLRKVQFQAFDTLDGSAALCPPTDALEGSHQSQEQCILHLQNVLKTIHDIKEDQIDAVTKALQTFASYLDGPMLLRYHDRICASSISLSDQGSTSRKYPTSRVSKAAAAYSRDFESLLAYLSPSSSASQSSIPGSNENLPRPPLVWEMRLADASAQLTRYWLRTIMNSVPERYEKNGTRVWKRRVDDLIDLEERPGREGDEDPTSSLVSNAASHIYQYVGVDPSQWKERISEQLLSDFCNSELCQVGVGKARHPTPRLTELQWEHVFSSFDSSSALVACYNRALFMDQLLSVLTALNIDKQWSATVQKAAGPLTQLSLCRDAMLVPCGMVILQPEDAHLALLGHDIPALQAQLQKDVLQPLGEHIEEIKANLLSSAAAFRLGGKKSRHKDAHQPHVGKLETHWIECLEPSLAFCSLTLNKPESDEES